MDTSATWEAWIGRSETAQDVAAVGPLEGLAALLDHKHPAWSANELPPLAHWLYFLPRAPMSQLGEDGHPLRGGFLPPIELPRRMWAGGSVRFLAPIAIGSEIMRTSTIRDVRCKQGASGQLAFVTIEHEISTRAGVAIVERQDIVFREAAKPGASTASDVPASPRTGQAERRAEAGSVALFRYSALTFNSHRIHYDRDYATQIEGYAGLVVNGPFQATLLMDHLLRCHPDAHVERFDFKAVRPLPDGAPFDLCLDRTPAGATLWCRDSSGRETMTAEAAFETSAR